MLDDLQLFVRIVDAGGLNAASRVLEMPAATLSRRLQALERRLVAAYCTAARGAWS